MVQRTSMRNARHQPLMMPPLLPRSELMLGFGDEQTALQDAFAHHTWATLRLLDACLALDAEQLSTAVPGTYGSILDTLRHLVGSDSSYLAVVTGGRTPHRRERHGRAGLAGGDGGAGSPLGRVRGWRSDPDEILVGIAPTARRATRRWASASRRSSTTAAITAARCARP